MDKNLEWIDKAKGDLNAGMYKAADDFANTEKKAVTFNAFLENIKESKGFESPYSGKSRFEVYRMRKQLRDAGQPVPLTAFEEIVKSKGIRIRGPFCDTVSKMYEFSETAVLVPEYWMDRLFSGQMLVSLIPFITMGEKVINGIDYHKVYSDDVEGDIQLAKVNPEAGIPVRKISVSEQSVRLKEYARGIEVDYRLASQMRFDALSAELQKTGMQIGIDQTDDVIYAILNGDGNSNSIPNDNKTNTKTSGAIVLEDVVAASVGLVDPYVPSVAIGRKKDAIKWLTALADFDAPMNTFGFMGQKTNPAFTLPAFYRWDRAVLSTQYIIVTDPRFNVEVLSNGGPVVETDKIISRGVSRAFTRSYMGVSVADKNANGYLNLQTTL